MYCDEYDFFMLAHPCVFFVMFYDDYTWYSTKFYYISR